MGAMRGAILIARFGISAVALAGVTALAMPLVQTATLASLTAPPVQLTSSSLSVESDGCTVTGDLTVSNTTGAAQRGVVWWDLSPPGATPPWLHAEHVSSKQLFDLAPHSSAALSWKVVAPIPTGSYEATYWIHVVPPNGGAMVHADGGRLGSLLIVSQAPDCSAVNTP